MLLQTKPILHSITLAQSTSYAVRRTFKRRESIPIDDGIICLIESGFVRTFTLTDDGTIVSLGLWGARDIIGGLFTCIQPYQMECLTDVKVVILKINECGNLDQTMLSHIHQMQALIQIRSGLIQQRLLHLLIWLAQKFGRRTDQGNLIQIRLTHQDIADLLGTTRVTVTRKLREMEQDGLIRWSRYHQILVH